MRDQRRLGRSYPVNRDSDSCGFRDFFRRRTAIEILERGMRLRRLGIVIVAAAMVIQENTIIQRAIDAELRDVPELAEQSGVGSNSDANEH